MIPTKSNLEEGRSSYDVSRIPGIEWLRVLAVSLVLLLHAKPISPCKTSSVPFLLFYPIAAFYDFVACLGVPMFFLISMFLLENKFQKERSYLGARLKRLIILFLFWTAIQFLIWGIAIVTGMEDSHSLAGSSLLATILVGGPPLPIVGDSVIYFISDLVLLTVVHYFIRGYLRSKNAKIVAISLFLVFFYIGPICRNLFFTTERAGSLVSVLDLEYYSPLNFLVFIPIAIWLNESHLNSPHPRRRAQGTPRLKVLLGLYLIALVGEIGLRLFTDMPFRVYARPSLLFGAWILMEIALRIRSAPLWVIKVSSLTLGVFAIHKYWLLVVKIFFPDLPILSAEILRSCKIDAADPIRLFLVAGLTYATAKALARYRVFRPFVS
jgi:hypothetical protein